MAFKKGQGLAAAQPSRLERGVRIGHQTMEGIPGHMTVRPILDQMIVQPIEGMRSELLLVVSDLEAVRGVVIAIGKGLHPTKYDHREKHKRTKAWKSRHFRPTTVKPGDIVHLGAFMFQTLAWGGQSMLMAREEDVCGVEPPELDMSLSTLELEAPEGAEWALLMHDEGPRWRAFRKLYRIESDDCAWFPLRGTFASSDEAREAVERYLEARKPVYLNASGERL